MADNSKYGDIANRVRAQMKDASLLDDSKASKIAFRTRATPKEKGEVSVEVQQTQAYKILTDQSLTPEQKTERLTELLTFDENALEDMVRLMNEDRALVAQLLSDFTAHFRLRNGAIRKTLTPR